ncbi:MAG: TolC family protein [Taibaiella sp.]|nr:TolC family protein [Taibaiella sp.]
MKLHRYVYPKECLRYLALLLLVYMPAGTHCQPLSLYTAVQSGIANYPLLQQRQAEVAESKAHITTVNGYRLPSLRLVGEVNTGTANSLPGAYFPLGLVPSVSGSVRAANRNDLTSGNIALSYLDWPFYTFGYYNAQRKNAQAALITTQAALNSDKYVLTENIISLYLDWLNKYRLLLIEAQNLQRTTTILNAIRATVLSGLKPGVDSTTANAQYAASRISYLQATDNYMYDKISLAAYTGLDTGALLPDTSIAGAAMLQKALLFPVTDSIVNAHPLLEVYERRYQQQLTNNSLIAHQYLPRVALEGAGWARGSSISPTGDVYNSDLSSGLAYSRYNYLFGLTLSYNLTDIKHRHDQIAEGRYAAQASQLALQTQQVNLNRMLQQTNVSYNSTLEKLKELPLQLQSAREAYGQQAALYKAGLNTLIDITNALYVLKQAETAYVMTQDELLQLLYLRAGLDNQLDVFLQTFKP